MHLGQQLASLKLQQSFVKELNEEDIDFAQKQYQKLYAEEMSKLSFKLERIQRVKKNLHDIERQENSKLKQKKQSLNKKYEFIEKNKQKYMTEKLKSYKIHHEVWENKITSIKRKNRQYMKAHAQKSHKYAEEVQNFWKTKTQQVFSSSQNHLDAEKKQQILFSRRSQKRNSIKMHTEGAEAKNLMPIKKQQNNEFSERKGNHSRRETKTIRFSTETHQQPKNSSNLSRKKNESNLTQKLSVHSLHNTKDNHQTDSKKALKMPYLDQNRFSQKLTNLKMNSTHDNLGSKTKFPIDDLHAYKINIRNEMLAEQTNFSFQKAMKKLEKIHRIKEKNIKKLEPKQTALSPCKPRKAIDAEQYRLLRAKSEVKKSKNKLDNEENVESRQVPSKERFMGSRTIRNHTLGHESRYHTTKNIDQSRMSIAQSRMKQEQEKAKQRSLATESETKKWKKERIVKAIKDKIFKIKLEEMQKIKEKKLVD